MEDDFWGDAENLGCPWQALAACLRNPLTPADDVVAALDAVSTIVSISGPCPPSLYTPLRDALVLLAGMSGDARLVELSREAAEKIRPGSLSQIGATEKPACSKSGGGHAGVAATSCASVTEESDTGSMHGLLGDDPELESGSGSENISMHGLLGDDPELESGSGSENISAPGKARRSGEARGVKRPRSMQTQGVETGQRSSPGAGMDLDL
jgi:hypothetical protein